MSLRHRKALILGHLALALAASAAAADAPESPVIAVFPAQNRAGDSPAALAVDRALHMELSRHARVIDPESTRSALRRLRIRNGDRAAPQLLRLLAGNLGADWLVSVTLHNADRRLVPRTTVSARFYASATGELAWAGFESGSGLDGRTLLGLGVTPHLEGLVPLVVANLLKGMPLSPGPADAEGSREPRARKTDLGTVAIVPFSASTPRRATLNAETVTEAARARLLDDGVDILSPNRSYEILRRLQSGAWGGVEAETRAALRDAGGARTILTGSVETYDVGGSEFEPEPRVTIAMRVLDASTGRILWTGALEREGWDGQGLFALGRVYSRGALAEDMMKTLTRRLDDEGLATAVTRR